jgi:hypothetical protein
MVRQIAGFGDNPRFLQWMEHYLNGPAEAIPPMEIDYGLMPAAKTSSTGWTPQVRSRGSLLNAVKPELQ